MLLARLVVEKRLALGGFHDAGVGDCAAPVASRRVRWAASSRMVRAARASALARRAISARASSVTSTLQSSQAALAVDQSPLQDRDELILAEAAQHVHAAAREQGGVDLERRILGRGADEDHGTLLDVGEEGVLLGSVEAVDLVHEQDRAKAAATALVLGLGNDLADLPHAREHGGERHETGAGHRSHQRGQGGLARAGRSPKDHRVQLACLDGRAQDAARPQEVLLADDLVQGAWPHPVGEGGFPGRALVETVAFRARAVDRDGSTALPEEIHGLARLVATSVSRAGRSPRCSRVCDRRHLPALEVSWVGAVGDEGYAGRARGGPVHPRIAQRRTRGERSRAPPKPAVDRCHFTDHPPAVGVGLELAHVVAGDGDVEQRVESEAREGLQGDVACVVRPERGLEPGRAGPASRPRWRPVRAWRRPAPAARGRARSTKDRPPGRAPRSGRGRSARRPGSGRDESAEAATGPPGGRACRGPWQPGRGASGRVCGRGRRHRARARR